MRNILQKKDEDTFTSQEYHLAQVNIARMLAPLGEPIMEGFVRKIGEINLLAENSKGFIWRMKSENDNTIASDIFQDEMLHINMSVWESVEDLKQFVYHTRHSVGVRRGAEWFQKMSTMYIALWWIPINHIPTLYEAKQKLDFLNQNGESEIAFTFKKIFLPG